jgi:hypothetical protein
MSARPDGPQPVRRENPDKQEACTVAVRWGPHLSFRGLVLGSACDHSLNMGHMRPVGLCMRGVTIECADQPWEIVRGAQTRICIRHLLFPWRVTMGIELRAGVCVSCVCFICFILDVAHVLSRCCICCNSYTRMLHVCFPNVLAVLSRCCICCSGYTRMLQMYIPNISPVADKCSLLHSDLSQAIRKSHHKHFFGLGGELSMVMAFSS